MKLYLKIIVLLFFSQVCQSQREVQKTNSEIISSGFKENDSLNILITYNEQIGCLGSYFGKIYIQSFNGKVVFFHVASNPKREIETFRTIGTNILDLIKDFEFKGKNCEKVVCGKTGEAGHGFKINLKINDKETTFIYCKTVYDGLDVLIQKMVAMKETQ